MSKQALAARMVAAYNRGVERGSMCDQDPFRFAEQVGIAVEFVPENQLQRAARADARIVGRTFLPTNFVQISNELTPRDAKFTAAHEIGHATRVDDGFEGEDAETICDTFASGFLAWVPSEEEKQREKARAIVEEGLDRQRRAAAARSRARYA